MAVATKYESGPKNDASWGDGILTTLNAVFQLECGTASHHRAFVDAGKPLYKQKSDLAVLHRSCLVIVEREGSGPGNIHDVVRWFLAVSNNLRIRLMPNQSGERPRNCEYNSVKVVLAFGRGSKWDAADFTKTIAYCQALADTLTTCRTPMPLSFHMLEYPSCVTDWHEAGLHFGERIAELLS
jgi:hypothetical protein